MSNSDLWALRDAIEHELEPTPEPEFVTTPYRETGHQARHGSDRPKRTTQRRRDYWRQWVANRKRKESKPMTTDEALKYMQDYIQWCRENGESDLRGPLHAVQSLRKELQANPDMPPKPSPSEEEA